MTDELSADPKASRRAKRRERADEASAAAGDPAAEATAEANPNPAGTEADEPVNRKERRAAAAQRRARRNRERTEAAAMGLDAGEMVDDALARSTDRLMRFTKRHFNVAQYVIVLGIAGWCAWAIYGWRTAKLRAQRSDEVMAGVHAAAGVIGKPEDQGKVNDQGIIDPTPIFASAEDRTKAAQAALEGVEDKGDGATALAKLNLAGVLLDAGKAKDAKATYEAVKGSAVAGKRPEIALRATEGIGLSLEAVGELDAALKAFRELESSDVAGFKDLGMYHQARLAFQKGETDAAKVQLAKLIERFKDDEPGRPSFLKIMAEELMMAIDPAAAATSRDPTPQQLEELKRAIEAMQRKAAPIDTSGAPVPIPMPEPPSVPSGAAP